MSEPAFDEFNIRAIRVGGDPETEPHQVRILLIPCFQVKEATHFALCKDPHTRSWREFPPRTGEHSDDLASRVEMVLREEAERRHRSRG